MEFDFEAWAKLSRDDPAEFERRREAALRELIDSAPARHRRRLEGLQFQVDMERQRSGSALGACLKLNSMMWASFFRLRKELNAITDPSSGVQEPPVTAEVISMQQFVQNRHAGATAEK